MGNLQTWSILLGVLLGLSLVSFLGLALLLLILLSRAAWRRSALRGGATGVGLACIALFLGAVALAVAAEDGSVPPGYSLLHAGIPGITLFLMAIVFPAFALAFCIGAGFGYLCYRPRSSRTQRAEYETE